MTKNNTKTKKVILFIVEGITDKATLGYVLSKLVSGDEIRFEITGGDIMARDNVTSASAVRAINRCVQLFLEKSRYLRSDILRIIHLTDTDGAYIPPERVEYSPGSGTTYLSDRILTEYTDETLSRISRKRAVTGRLAQMTDIRGIPYSLFFFSRNIEHVVHGIASDISSKRKVKLSGRFEDRFADAPREFIAFMNNPEFAVSGDYAHTWEYIFTGINSLLRRSNFHIYLNTL